MQTDGKLDYLQILDDLAHDVAHVPGLCDVTYDGRGQADQTHHEVRQSEVHDEVVGDSAHVRVPPHGEAHQEVPDQSENLK